VIRSLLQYGRYFLQGTIDPGLRALLVAHAKGPRTRDPMDHVHALHAVADHLCRAQENGSDKGLGSYHLIHGWSASYPETTGYIIPTLLQLSDHLNRSELMQHAAEAADWLLAIQMKEGGWQGGRVNEARPAVVFNTAQVVRGMMAMHDRTGDAKYLQAAIRACDWMVSVQEEDGSWKRHNFLQRARVYDSYVCAPLLRMHQICGERRYHAAALKDLDWIMARQLPNGWFPDADNTVKHNDRPITHTIAYTLDGLLESFSLTGDERLLRSASVPARTLLDIFLRSGRLHGRYDRNWRGSELPLCTGNAQLAIVWAGLHSITGEKDFWTGVERMTNWLMAVQALSATGPIGGQGAVTGSFPLWGRYEKFAFPNWAQKYFADALLCASGKPPRF
jgi:hypothetical protein